MSSTPFLPKLIRYLYTFHMLKHIPNIKGQEKWRDSAIERVFKHYPIFKRGVSNSMTLEESFGKVKYVLSMYVQRREPLPRLLEHYLEVRS